MVGQFCFRGLFCIDLSEEKMHCLPDEGLTYPELQREDQGMGRGLLDRLLR